MKALAKLRSTLRPVRIAVRKRWRPIQLALVRAQLPTIPRSRFLAEFREAVRQGRPYATGKIGRSPQHWMYYALLRDQGRSMTLRFKEEVLRHGNKQSGIFPADLDFYLEFNRFYVEHLRNLDCIGVCRWIWEPRLLRHYRLKNAITYYESQEIDLSIPVDEGNCYLPALRGKRILIICPFARVLAERATRETFEGVWAKTGRRWFEPESVAAIELPYGFDPEAQHRYGNVLNLYEELVGRIEGEAFDIALIGAGALAIPLASHVKRLGKIGFDLGGHLQLIFGVYGKRWLSWDDGGWFARYATEHWLRTPPEYRPANFDEVCDRGAYW